MLITLLLRRGGARMGNEWRSASLMNVVQTFVQGLFQFAQALTHSMSKQPAAAFSQDRVSELKEVRVLSLYPPYSRGYGSLRLR